MGFAATGRDTPAPSIFSTKTHAQREPARSRRTCRSAKDLATIERCGATASPAVPPLDFAHLPHAKRRSTANHPPAGRWPMYPKKVRKHPMPSEKSTPNPVSLRAPSR